MSSASPASSSRASASQATASQATASQAAGTGHQTDIPLDSRPAVAKTGSTPLTSLPGRLTHLDEKALRQDFDNQGKFLFLRDFLPSDLCQAVIDGMQAARTEMNRNFLPGHKKGGSVSRYTIDKLAPVIAELYRSPALIGWLESVCGEALLPSPDTDPHAYALYFYTEPGDHIGWHYDTSYYKGRRYTVLLGVVDRSSSKLEYKLHTRDPSRVRTPDMDASIGLDPGALVFFDGDQLSHRITPLGEGEERVSLTFEYVTDPRMGRWQRFISNMKDAVAYFGFRQVFRRAKH